ncbi:MAG: MBL fold metallo-hydrolase [Alphaproteobacteria bacterium]
METHTSEIGDGIYRLSTLLPGVGGPAGLTFNQFLIVADEPLLFHTGQRALFPGVSAAVARLLPLDRLRWISFSHVESDECGGLDDFIAAAPNATAVHGTFGCNLWLNDHLARPPRKLANDEVLDLGGKRVRWLDTPNVPHDLNAGLMFEETTRTLICSDLFAHAGESPALSEADILGPAIETMKVFPFTPLTPTTAPTMRRLAGLAPTTLAVMHGASFWGDGASQLEGLAAHYDNLLREALA